MAKIIMGPILRFEGMDNAGWHISILVVTEGAPEQGVWNTASATPQTIAPKRLKAFAKRQVSSYRFTVPQIDKAQRISWQVAGAQGDFVVPDLNAMPHIAYASCNGFSSLKEMKRVAEKNAMWVHLFNRHKVEPYHLLLMGGDQIYADSIWSRCPSIYDWLQLDERDRIQAPFSPKMAREVAEFYFQLYCDRWQQPEPLAVMRGVPTVMMWDDHEIFDGWGSYADNVQKSPVYQGIFKIAEEHFRLFQLHIKPGEMPSGAFSAAQKGLGYGFRLGKRLTLAALDMRSERSITQVLSKQSWREFEAWLNAEAPAHLIIMSSIPVVHPNYSSLEQFADFFNAEITDDLRDHWHSRAHKQERLELIHLLLKYSEAKKCRVTIVSGDVHVGAVGMIHSTRNAASKNANVIIQLTSSAIVHPAPPKPVLFFHKLASRNTESVDRGITAEMMEFPATNRQQFIGERNWLSLDCDADSTTISANWYAEGSLDTPYNKLIHAVEGTL